MRKTKHVGKAATEAARREARFWIAACIVILIWLAALALGAGA